MSAATGVTKRRVFIDMDGVLVDFERHMGTTGLTADVMKHTPGSYAAMPQMPHAVDAVHSILAMGFEVWIATKPPTGAAHAYSGKVDWILEHLPELQRHIIITHNKGLLGNEHDFLIDDRPHKADCEKFAGTLIRFGPEFGTTWSSVLSGLKLEPTTVEGLAAAELDDDDLGSLIRCINGVERIAERRAFSQSRPDNLFSKQTPRAMTITDAVEIAGPVLHQLRKLLEKLSTPAPTTNSSSQPGGSGTPRDRS